MNVSFLKFILQTIGESDQRNNLIKGLNVLLRVKKDLSTQLLSKLELNRRNVARFIAIQKFPVFLMLLYWECMYDLKINRVTI